MQQSEVSKWISTLKPGDVVGVFSGSKMLFSTKVAKVTATGRIVCEPGGTFNSDGDIIGQLADKTRRLRPAINS